ncbi:MAG TPA: DUF4382 domain-containing protein [Longimicrobiales bacterium]
MIRRLTHAIALSLAVLLPVAACDDGPGPDNTRISIRLTDAAGDIEAAVVTISEIYLQGGDGEGQAEGETDAAGRVVLRDEPVTTDLVTLANDIETLVEGAVVPSGTYAQLRFVITGGYVAVENAQGDIDVFATEGYEPPAGFEFPEGSEVAGTLQCPSCGQSGLKVNVSGGLVVDGGEEDLLVDFDVAESFGHGAGKSGHWVMEPVITATDLDAVGSVHVAVSLGTDVTLPVIGNVQIGLGDLEVRLINEDGNAEVLALTDEDEDGTFEAEFMFLLPGSYQVELALPAGLTIDTEPALPLTLDVEAGATAEAEISLISASGA